MTITSKTDKKSAHINQLILIKFRPLYPETTDLRVKANLSALQQQNIINGDNAAGSF